MKEDQSEFSEDVPVVMQRHASQERIQERIIKETDVPVPRMMKKTIELAKHIPQERLQNNTVDQTVEVPISKIQEETVEVIQLLPQDRMSDRVVQQITDSPSSTDSVADSSHDVQMPVPAIQVAQKTVKELRSTFEVGHTNKVHARNPPDRNRWRKKQELEATQYPQDIQERTDPTNQRQVPAIRSVQKTVEVPRVQYINKVADISVDMQRQGSTIQAAQYIDEVVDVSVPKQSVAPTVPDTDDLCLNETADEDGLEHENKKRRLPTPAEAVSESRADESDFDRFDDLVLPSPEGKTLFVSIASGDEAEDEPDKQQDMTLSLVQGGESIGGRDRRTKPRTQDSPGGARRVGPRIARGKKEVR